MSWHPAPPDPKPPQGKPVRLYESIGPKPRGTFDRRTYQRDYMRNKRAQAKQVRGLRGEYR